MSYFIKFNAECNQEGIIQPLIAEAEYCVILQDHTHKNKILSQKR